MKKFYSFLFAAVALVGFTACNSDNTEEPAPQKENVGKVEFTANIDDSRTNLEGLSVTWSDENESIAIKSGENVYEFKIKKNSLSDDKKSATFTYAGDDDFIASESMTAVYPYNAEAATTIPEGQDGTFGKAMVMTGTVADNVITFNSHETVILTFSVPATCKEVKINDTVVTAEADFKTGETYYASVAHGTKNLEVRIDGYLSKSAATKEDLAAGTVYSLGELPALKAHEMFGIVGDHQGWSQENKDALYWIGENTYARYGVTLKEEGFKFYGEKTEIVTVEHPAVTTGEEGDWFLTPNSNWKTDGARFAIYFFGDGETWVSMKDDNGDGIYVGNYPNDGKKYTTMIFCRMNPSTTANNWDNKWNQTGDLTIPTNGNNHFKVPSGSWDGATTSWSVHTPEVKDAWTEEVEKVTPYWIGTGTDDGDSNGWVTRWSNNVGNENITITDTSKTYDIYFSKGEDKDWGFEVYYTVLEHGSETPTLK